MDIYLPYMISAKNLHAILDKVQHAAVPEAFGHDFLKDLGFSSTNDRTVIKILKYLGLLDAPGRPQSVYSDLVDLTNDESPWRTLTRG